ncbi:MAG TPA: DUF6286 domain-containing protein [Arthrobacter sp.]
MSRTRSQALHRRPSRSLPATITAVVLLLLAVAGAWAGIERLATGRWPAVLGQVRQALSDLPWNNPAVWAGTALLTVLGLILLLAAVLPGKYTTLPLAAPGTTDARPTETVISRRGLATIARAHLDQADGVDHATVSATGKKVTALVRTPMHEAPHLAGQLQDSLRRRFEQMGVDPLPHVQVNVRTTT